MVRPVGRFALILAAILAIGASLHGLMAQTAPALRVNLADPGPVGAATTTALFAQVAVGGGFTTTFTLLNTGSTALTGNLILTKSDGTPMNVSLGAPSGNPSFAPSTELVVGSSTPINIPSGGTTFLTATPANPDDYFVGWGRVESSGGTLGGVATFSLTSAGQLQAIAGVLSADVTSVATIPVDDDVSQNRATGYAVANPGSSSITIRVVEVSADGNTITALSPINLDPGKQTAAFFFQDKAAAQKFRGSAVLIGQAGATFSVVALLQVQGATGLLYTAIPVIPAKAPNIN